MSFIKDFTDRLKDLFFSKTEVNKNSVDNKLENKKIESLIAPNGSTLFKFDLLQDLNKKDSSFTKIEKDSKTGKTNEIIVSLNEKLKNHTFNYQNYFNYDEGLKIDKERSWFLEKEGFKKADLVLYDPQVRACFNTLIFSVLKKKFTIKIADSDSKESQELKGFIDFCFDTLKGSIYDICYSLSISMLNYGYAISEKIYDFSKKGDYDGKLIINQIKSKKAGVVGFDLDDFDNIIGIKSLNSFSSKNHIFDTSEFIYCTFLKIFEDPYGQDLFGSLSNLIDTKRQIFTQMIVSNIKFASGTVVITIPNGLAEDESTIAYAKNIVENIQSGSGVAKPEGMILEILEQKGVSKDIYLDRLHYIDSQISLTILGNDLTTTQSHGGGTRAESQVKFEVTNIMVLYLQRYLEEIINEQFIDDLCSYNYDINKYPKKYYPKIEFIEEREEDKKILCEIFVQMIEKEILKPATRINDEIFIRQQLNLPELDKKEVDEIVKEMKQKQIDLQVIQNKQDIADKEKKDKDNQDSSNKNDSSKIDFDKRLKDLKTRRGED